MLFLKTTVETIGVKGRKQHQTWKEVYMSLKELEKRIIALKDSKMTRAASSEKYSIFLI